MRNNIKIAPEGGIFKGGNLKLHFVDRLYEIEKGFGAFGGVSDFGSGAIGLF